MTLVSIIIPTYKRQNLLQRAIKSALSQTYKNIEVLVCDDEKSAATKAIAESIAKNDNRLRYLENVRTKGVSGARNTGIYAAKGEYCIFLDDDDEMLFDAIEALANNVPEEAAFGCGWRNFCDRNGKTEIHKHIAEIDFDFLVKRGSCASGPAMFVQTSRLKTIGGFDEAVSVTEDYDLSLRLTKRFGAAIEIEKVTINYYIHDGDRLSANGLKLYKGKRSIILKHGKDFGKRARALYLYRTRRNYYGINPRRAFAWLPLGKAIDELRRYIKRKYFSRKNK
ncbi:MAG: glycosyltransferase [Helicobacteraceae bacterium]|nr:glycosyltransferase [Helicobacteraceae bacterium]